jgi:hypothetical protein
MFSDLGAWAITVRVTLNEDALDSSIIKKMQPGFKFKLGTFLSRSSFRTSESR